MGEEAVELLKEKLSNGRQSLVQFLQDERRLQICYEEELTTYKRANDSLKKENQSLQVINQQLITKVDGLERQLNQTADNEVDRLKAWIERLEYENRELRRSLREPLKEIKNEQQANSIPVVKSENLETQMLLEMSSSQRSSNDEDPWSTNNDFDEKYDQTYDVRKHHSKVTESIDLRAGNIDISSSPVKSQHYHKIIPNLVSPVKPNLVSPVKLKQEHNHKDVVEINDSFEYSDDDIDFKLSFPTPNTTVKQMKTPLIKTKRFSSLNTPNETPSKKAKTKLKLDLSNNTKKKREWILEDFKVNPALNNNEEKAYQIVLRDKSTRSCIHGKTCQSCEKFYKALKEIPNYEMLGPQWNDQSWKEASKNFQIVTKTSRHKELWNRPDSAPGFGQYDFPTTQELGQNRALADLRNKRIAYERLYSALNDKKFLFKDEEYNQIVKRGEFKVDKEVFFKYLQRSEDN